MNEGKNAPFNNLSEDRDDVVGGSDGDSGEKGEGKLPPRLLLGVMIENEPVPVDGSIFTFEGLTQVFLGVDRLVIDGYLMVGYLIGG